MRLALFESDISQNTGAMLRLGACLGVGVDIVEPCGFVWSDRRLRRAGMDYLERVDLARHEDWAAFRRTLAGRLVLLTTAGATRYTDFAFAPDDTLLVGHEGGGVPPEIAAFADATLRVPMRPGERSLNVALAAAMVLGEALRQTQGFPDRHEQG
jgi:tRNA (cytidine/uridine-2'-O-)-methyltransferase